MYGTNRNCFEIPFLLGIYFSWDIIVYCYLCFHCWIIWAKIEKRLNIMQEQGIFYLLKCLAVSRSHPASYYMGMEGSFTLD